MPPRASSGPKVPDPKTRKLTDFWGRSENGNSSPAGPTSHSQNAPSRLSSPVKSAGAFASGGLLSRTFSSASNTSNKGQLAGSSFSQSSSPRKSGTNALSPSKGTPSPRKYIMIEDDENDDDPTISNSASRKRAREPATVVVISSKDSTPSASTPPNSSGHVFIDLTDSPPHKKRALEVEAPSHRRNASSQSHSRKAIFPNVPNRHAAPKLPSYTDDDVVILDVMGSTKISSRSHADFAPNTKVSLPPTPVSPVSSIPNLASSQYQSFEDRTAAKIEEMKRRAEMRVNAATVTTSARSRALQSMQVEDSEDDDDDFLDKLTGTTAAKKGIAVATTVKPLGKPLIKRTSTPTAADIFSSSPLTELDSDNSPPPKPARRATVGEPSTSKTSNKSRIPPPPKFESSKAPSKANSQENTVIKPRAAMPLALAMLLDEKPKSDAAKEAKRKALLKAVEEDMKEMERKRIYGDLGDSKDSQPLQEVDPSVTEMALGEQAQRINVIIASDSSARREGSHWRPFWDEQLVGSPVNAMDVNSSVPILSVPHASHPIIARLQRAIQDNETARIFFLLNRRIITSISADVSKQLAPWLFRVASSCEVEEDLAIAAEVSFCSLFSALDGKITECPLQFSDILGPVLLLGPLQTVIESAFPASTTMPSALPRDPITRIQTVGRVIRMIRCMSREGVILCDPTNTIALLLLLYLEPSTPTETRRDISLAIEDLLHTISCHTLHEIRTQELDICKNVVNITTKFRLTEKYQLLLCIFGGQPGARRFMRWLAVGMVLPSAIPNLQWDDYLRPPPLNGIVEMLDLNGEHITPFEISNKTDYEKILYNTEVIGTILTDISQYQPSQASHLEGIVNGLDLVHNKKSDSRAAFLDRTRAKDALQRLKIRLQFQLQQTLSRAATIDSMLRR